MTRGRHPGLLPTEDRCGGRTSRSPEPERAPGEFLDALISSLVVARAELMRVERSLRQAVGELCDGRMSLDDFVFDVQPFIETERVLGALDGVDATRG